MAANMFREKMALLNSNFLQFLQQALSSKPSADLTPTVKDYMKHVEELDRLYGGVGTSTSSTTTPVRVDSEKVKEKQDLLPSTSTPFTAKPTTNEPIFGKKMPEFSFEKKSTEKMDQPQRSDLNGNGSRSLSRKRKKDGGGDEDYDKVRASIQISDHKTSSTPVSSFKEAATAFKQAQEAEKITPNSTISPISSIFPKPSSITSLPNFPPFTTSTPIQQAEDKTKAAPPPVASFRFNSPPQPSTTTTNETPASKPTIPLFTFGQPPKSTTEEKDKAEIKIPPFSFGNQGFPSSIQPTTSQKEIATEAKKPISLLSDKDLRDELTKYGFTTGPVTPSTRKVYEKKLENFRTNEPKLQENKAEEKTDDNEPQEAPPVVEVVEHKEPDAICSAKCALFGFSSGEYKKVGIGFLHVKKLEKNFQLLLRAANTLGVSCQWQ
uniref:LEM domain-containing protein n=1 Tax=Acrobeloides nanus TaxID=290746 RepID=A0A914CDC7_9BILA